MNRADVEMLNQAMAGMGQSFLQNRVLDQAAKERELERSLKERMLTEQMAERREETGAREEQYKAQQKHWNLIEERQADADKLREQNSLQAFQDRQAELQRRGKEFAHSNWDSTVKFFGDAVKDGLMEPDRAQAAVQQAFEKMPPQGKALLADNPSVLAMQGGETLWKTPKDKRLKSPAVQNDEAAAELEDKADEIEQNMAELDPRQQKAADALRARAKLLREPKAAAQSYETVTEAEDPITGQTARRVVTRQPIGQPSAPTIGGPTDSPITRYTRDKNGRLVTPQR